MKNKIIISSLSFLFIISLIGIVYYFRKQELRLYYPDTATFVYDMPICEIEEEMGIQEEWINSYHVLKSLLLTDAERIIMLEYKNNYKEDIINNCHAYIDSLKNQYIYKKQEISQYQEYLNDKYYVLIVSENADRILEDLKRKLI